NKPVNEITTIDVLAVLKPLWQTKNETASRLRGRIEAVLDAAKALKYRTGENPAAWKGNLAHLLSKRQKLYRGHQAALPYSDIPGFMRELRSRPSTSALALEFTILTAGRTNEILGARWSEFDLDDKIWTIPAERMKMAKVHRVPLSDRCVEIVRMLRPNNSDGFIFTGPSNKKQLSNMAMLMLLRSFEQKITVHGFRSSFRDWAGNETNHSREVVEEALAHQIGDEVERAYRRSDAIEKRRMLMNDWTAFCLQMPAENVIPFSRA
ncbi:MAG: integrase, partial [Methylocystaceae bacterium]|nr:integrase [Methylocystaceae bacterium]